MGEVRLNVEQGGQRVGVEEGRHLPVGAEEGEQRGLVGVGLQRVALDDGVGCLAAQARLDQGEQHLLGEDEALRGVEVAAHPLRVHLEARHDAGEEVQHVRQQPRRVREDDALDRAVRDVALVPQRDVLEARL